MLDTSDELIDLNNNISLSDDNPDSFSGQQQPSKRANREDGTNGQQRRDRYYDDNLRPGTSQGSNPQNRGVARLTDKEIAKNRADQLVRQAEANKAKILEVSGEINSDNEDLQVRNNVSVHRHHPSLVDEDYLVVGGHVDELTRLRIENGEYIDFARLLPRDRQIEEDNRMEIVNQNGRTFFVPATGSESGSITNFSRWEQAFRVFSNVYTRRFPERSAELIQYNHIIHTAALTFTWENVYLYDRDFRLHISRYPGRSWAIILQQAWTMRLKDRNGKSENSRSEKVRGKKDVCWRYNQGRCTFGSGCKFEHRCAVCNKYGHGAHICRKANNKSSRSDADYDRNFDRKDDYRDRRDRQDRHHKGGQRVRN